MSVGTIKLHFEPEVFHYRSSAPFPSYVKTEGSVSPITGLAFPRGVIEQFTYLTFRAVNYGSGNWTARLGWFSQTVAAGNVLFGFSIACLTANTDVKAVGSEAFDAETIVTGTHLGTIATRPHDSLGTLPNLDSASTDDWVTLRISRKVTDNSDTLNDVVVLTSLDLSWSDT
jgi:hypothetical protein